MLVTRATGTVQDMDLSNLGTNIFATVAVVVA